MTIAHLLEDFAPGADLYFWQTEQAHEEQAEIKRLEAYEEGYKAGWDDAVVANQAEHLQVAADFSQNLRDMSFTYQEACAHVTNALQGVFDELLTHFLPKAAQESLSAKVREEIEGLPLGAEHMAVIVSVAPENLTLMERLIDDFPDNPPRVIADPSLTGGQATIEFDETELVIDFDALMTELAVALKRVAYPDAKEVMND